MSILLPARRPPHILKPPARAPVHAPQIGVSPPGLLAVAVMPPAHWRLTLVDVTDSFMETE